MADFLWYPINDLPFIFLVLVIAFTVHEFAHAYSAYKFGDRTAYDAGRVTLNPRVHLDVLGTILLLVAGFGWAKPVMVNRGELQVSEINGDYCFSSRAYKQLAHCSARYISRVYS